MKTRLVNENFKNNYVDNLLRANGVKNPQEYYTPSQSFLAHPSKLENIHQAAELLIEIMEHEGNVLLVLDCDMDGYTSGAIIYQYIYQVWPGANLSYVLHNGKQHGLEDHIKNIIDGEEHYDLIILPDSSSNDYIYHEQLKEINTKVLVLDHHITDEKLSDNAVIVNNQLSAAYENKELTGAGVAFQFCRYIDEVYNVKYAEQYMDLAAAGIIGDMGAVTEMENRYIIYEGLRHLNNKMLWALARKQAYSITGEMNATDTNIIDSLNPISVAFYIVPLVNAVIRVGTQAEKERLFLGFIDGDKLIPSNKRGAKGTMEKVAIESARECGNIRNRQNKLLEDAMFAMEVKITNNDLLSNKILFCRLEEEDDFPSELTGLLAMKLSAKYKKPTIVARKCNDGVNKGSMRGLNQSEMGSFKTFLESSGYFTLVAGHDNAAGAQIPDKYLSAFHEYANQELANVDFGENCYDVNFERIAADADICDLIEDIGENKDIWGQGLNEPYIHITDINITWRDIQIMGAGKDTVKIIKNGVSYMKFKAKDFIEDLKKYSDIKLEVVGRANLNYWGGRVTPQIFIDDYEIKDNKYGF